jgi:hypothetical protein
MMSDGRRHDTGRHVMFRGLLFSLLMSLTSLVVLPQTQKQVAEDEEGVPRLKSVVLVRAEVRDRRGNLVPGLEALRLVEREELDSLGAAGLVAPARGLPAQSSSRPSFSGRATSTILRRAWPESGVTTYWSNQPERITMAGRL